MNKVILMGRLTRDVELNKTSNEVAYCKFSVAVNRKFADANGNKQTDFINCVAWRNNAEFVNKYFKKGSQMLISGSIQTTSYEANDGTKKQTTEVLIEEIEFVDKKTSDSNNEQPKKASKETLENVNDDDLPF